MAKPTLLTVDDDPNVLKAIERDLRSHYGENYRVLRADSGDAGLKILRELRVRNDAVALLLADQRMPHMDGIGFLHEAKKIYPDAKRALLTAYADTSAAIDAINEVNINYFFLKPWDPPSQHLYPVIDELLEDWSASYRRRTRAFACWARAGRREPTRCAIFWRAIMFPISGSMLSWPSEDPEVKQVIASIGRGCGEFAAGPVSRWHPHVSVDLGGVGGEDRPAHSRGNAVLRSCHHRRRAGEDWRPRCMARRKG